MCDMFLRNAIYLPSANVEVSAMHLISSLPQSHIRVPAPSSEGAMFSASLCTITKKGQLYEHYK